MALLSALLMLASAPTAPMAVPAEHRWQARAGAEVRAQASVRIVSAARVRPGRSLDSGPYTLTNVRLRLEDGSMRPAKLVEFQ